uniref:ATP synthase complex subunit 8 n=1 Tax=Bregmaceros nectabanus TaxID=181412 RepID=Q8HM99_BRENE|nr:ATPase subunit 8 [Bregmaceros nectabanus]
MPQLNPIPWFSIAVFTWMIFLFIMLPKVYSHQFPNNPSFYKTSSQQSTSWNWPWH